MVEVGSDSGELSAARLQVYEIIRDGDGVRK